MYLNHFQNLRKALPPESMNKTQNFSNEQGDIPTQRRVLHHNCGRFAHAHPLQLQRCSRSAPSRIQLKLGDPGQTAERHQCQRTWRIKSHSLCQRKPVALWPHELPFQVLPSIGIFANISYNYICQFSHVQ